MQDPDVFYGAARRAFKSDGLEGHGKSILNEASVIVDTDRSQQYGHPRDAFERVGIVWAAILDASGHAPGEAIPARIVGLLMIALKVDREAHRHKDDNLVDIAGYAACVAEITATRLSGGAS